ncbi:uracil-DNA glycosylase [Iodidimonas muriae]|uniref:Type-5 uracil-DNA glycosylase n=1 Tax=Iodidimonas muriae TaxID=261467 RepID=A0ABQ2L6M8_9PROT|nr:uracil-DNA glycosylase [Iodidimonas muriae]GER06571.1 uracil-DNA glycosylase [Kordiimonadales bacterium JCM 17843]GGO05318.1 uracil-DNA glycosylase [Iodidimonas muriae]
MSKADPSVTASLNECYPANPPADCALCPRLVQYREDNRRKFPDFFNGAVPSFGDPDAEILIVGLAPGVRGANRTARPFTGDYAGNLLYPTLVKFGFATGTFKADPEDGLRLNRAMVTNAVRCVPPENKPTGAEVRTCRPYLLSAMDALPNLKVLFILGRIAHDTVLTSLGQVRSKHPFGHGAVHRIGDLVLVDSYHCSRYNVNTGRLTTEMFEQAFEKAVEAVD